MFSKFRQTAPTGKIEYLIVGLGNPGREYENTRHNCGFIALDYLSQKLDCKMNKIKFKSTIGECSINCHRCILMKPSTYMNLSGQAVVEAMNFYKIPPQNVIVIFDDISLDVGKMRIRRKGSDGGQKGMQNIIYLSGSQDFPRIKVGIGKKPHPDYDLKKWVLSRFSASEQKLIEPLLQNIFDAVSLMVDNNIDKAMNLYNS